MHGAPLAGRGRAARHLERADAGGRRGPGSSAPACRPRTSTSAASRRATRARERAAVHGLQVGPAQNQATEDDVTIPAGPFAGGTTMQVSYMRLRLDSWYEQLDERERVARMYAPQVTPDAGQPLHHRRRRATPTSRAGDRPLRRRRARPDVGPRPAQRQAADHPARLQHRRRRPGGAALRLPPALDRGLRHDPQRDEREPPRSSRTRRSPTPSTTASTSSSSSLKRANYILPPRPERSFPLLPGGQRAAQLKLRRARGSGRRRPPAAPCRARSGGPLVALGIDQVGHLRVVDEVDRRSGDVLRFHRHFGTIAFPYRRELARLAHGPLPLRYEVPATEVLEEVVALVGVDVDADRDDLRALRGGRSS